MLIAGCVHYPTIMDVGGTRIRPERGRAVRQADGVAVYFDLKSTGTYGDAITAVSSEVARRAMLVDAQGVPVARLDVPGTTTMSFTAGGPHVVISDLTRPLVAGETIIVTLTLEKAGGLGIVTTVE